MCQQFMTETGIEGRNGIHIPLERHMRQIIFLWYNKHIGQKSWVAQRRVGIVHSHTSPLWMQKSHHQVKHGALTGAVLAQQAINTPTGQFQAEIVKHLVPAIVTETYVFKSNHSVIVK